MRDREEPSSRVPTPPVRLEVEKGGKVFISVNNQVGKGEEEKKGKVRDGRSLYVSEERRAVSGERNLRE